MLLKQGACWSRFRCALRSSGLRQGTHVSLELLSSLRRGSQLLQSEHSRLHSGQEAEGITGFPPAVAPGGQLWEGPSPAGRLREAESFTHKNLKNPDYW